MYRIGLRSETGSSQEENPKKTMAKIECRGTRLSSQAPVHGSTSTQRQRVEGCMKMHHIGILTKDIRSGIRHHEALFNIRPTTEIVEDPIQKVSLVLLSGQSMAGTYLELIQPLTDDSPVSNIVKRGMPLYHLCFEVEDIEEALEKTRISGSIIISGPTPAKLFNGRRIAFVYGPDHYVVEFLETQERP